MKPRTTIVTTLANDFTGSRIRNNNIVVTGSKKRKNYNKQKLGKY